MTATVSRLVTAFLDGEDSPDITNPIHSTAVAQEFGFKAALVGGVTVYGWTAPAIIEALGASWLDNGWADVAFRQPVYPGDVLTIRVDVEASGAAALEMANQDGIVCVRGTLGLGDATFLADLKPTVRLTAEPRPTEVPWLTLEGAPVGQDLRPMSVPITVEDAKAYALEKQADDDPRWLERIHPGWLAARMTPLIHHSYDYAPAIHTRSQIQHVGAGRVGGTVTVAGHFVEAFERNGHHYGVVDGIIIGQDGAPIARIRHTTIFRVAKRD